MIIDRHVRAVAHIPFDVSKTMLDRRAVPGMCIVEIPSALAEARIAFFLFEWGNEILRFADVRLVSQQALSGIQWRAVLSEHLDI